MAENNGSPNLATGMAKKKDERYEPAVKQLEQAAKRAVQKTKVKR